MIVLDTHVVVWWVDGERRKLSRKASQALRRHGERNELLVSSISFFEITTLERRGRLRFSMPATMWLANVRRLPEYRFEPITDDIAERAGQFGDAFPGDPADRLVAATDRACAECAARHSRFPADHLVSATAGLPGWQALASAVDGRVRRTLALNLPGRRRGRRRAGHIQRDENKKNLLHWRF